jgi:hypothetical protein
MSETLCANPDCGHRFAAHTRNFGEENVSDVIQALPGLDSGFDVYAGDRLGDSACTMCACRAWRAPDTNRGK